MPDPRNDAIELYGWKTLQIPTRALFNLSNREFRVYCYFVFRGREKDRAWPGISRMVSDLQDMSESTAKRAIAGLVAKKWVLRFRQGTTSSLTIVFASPEDQELYLASREAKKPVVRSPLSRQSGHHWSVNKDSEKEDSESHTTYGASPQAILEDWRATMNAAIDNGKGVNVSAALARLARELELPPYAGLPTVPSSMIARMGRIAKMADPGGRARDGMWDVADKMCYVAELDEPVTNVLDYLTKCYQPESDDWLDAALRSLEAMGDGS